MTPKVTREKIYSLNLINFFQFQIAVIGNFRAIIYKNNVT